MTFICPGMHASGSECCISVPSNGRLCRYMSFFLSNPSFSYVGRPCRRSRCRSSTFYTHPCYNSIFCTNYVLSLSQITHASLVEVLTVPEAWVGYWVLNWVIWLAAGWSCWWNRRRYEKHHALQYFRYLPHAFFSKSAPHHPERPSSGIYSQRCYEKNMTNLVFTAWPLWTWKKGTKRAWLSCMFISITIAYHLTCCPR